MIQPINYTVPLFDRRFDFNQEELSALELNARTVKKINEVIEEVNGWFGTLDNYELSSNITSKRKLSVNGNFTGNIQGKPSSEIVHNVYDSQDKIRYLASQFSDGYTGLVIDGGFFEDSNIKKNYDGGIF